MKRVLITTLAVLGVADAALAAEGQRPARNETTQIYRASGQRAGGPARNLISPSGSGRLSVQGTVSDPARAAPFGLSGSGQQAGGPAAKFYTRGARAPRSLDGTVMDPNRVTPFGLAGSGHQAGGPAAKYYARAGYGRQ